MATLIVVGAFGIGMALGHAYHVAKMQHRKSVQHMTFEQLVQTIVRAESGGNARAVGAGGERGLMQIDRRTWKWLTDLPFSSAFDGSTNLQVGSQLVAMIEEKYHTRNAAYVAYRWNCGSHSRMTFSDWKKMNKNKVYRGLYS